MRINPLTNIQNPALQQLSNATSSTSTIGPKAGGKDGGDFANTLMDVLKEVNNSQQTAAQKQNQFMTGQQVDYHDLMISVEKASISMQLTMAVRNKILDAYSEVSHMQV